MTTPKELTAIIKIMKKNRIKKYEDGKGLCLEFSEADFARPEKAAPPRGRHKIKNEEDLVFTKPASLSEVFQESDSFAVWEMGGAITEKVD